MGALAPMAPTARPPLIHLLSLNSRIKLYNSNLRHADQAWFHTRLTKPIFLPVTDTLTEQKMSVGNFNMTKRYQILVNMTYFVNPT